MNAVALAVYNDLIASLDDTTGDLATFVGALGDQLFQEVDDYASDGPLGQVGWSVLLDINRIPDKGLEWLAQFVGVSLPVGLTAAQKRVRVQTTAGWKRGTPAALVGAAKAYLTGTQNVLMRERFDVANPTVDTPGKFQVITYTSQTPDSAAVLAALIAQKPGGLVMTYSVYAGQDWLAVRTRGTWLNIRTTFATWQQIRDNPAGI